MLKSLNLLFSCLDIITANIDLLKDNPNVSFLYFLTPLKDPLTTHISWRVILKYTRDIIDLIGQSLKQNAVNPH